MSWLYTWVYDILSYVGLRWELSARIIFLGLDNAGKSTLLHLLRDGHLHAMMPTNHPVSEELTFGNVRLICHDLGGHQTVRELWKTYSTTADAIVYIVDASDRERLPESRRELHELLAIEDLRHVPFLILGNKIDRVGAMSGEELEVALGLEMPDLSMDTPKKHPSTIRLYMCCLVRMEGYSDGIAWVASALKAKQQRK